MQNASFAELRKFITEGNMIELGKKVDLSRLLREGKVEENKHLRALTYHDS